MKFGHHQSFYLRVNWLSKAFKMVNQNPRFFYDEFGFEKIGLGRNMVKSLRFWSVATGVMSERIGEARKPIHELTPVGELVCANDRFIRLPITAGVLHVLLSLSKDNASAWYWYFNFCTERSASVDGLLERFREWVANEQKRAVSIQSLRRDLDCIRLLYTSRSRIGDDPEEVIGSPFSMLNLLQESRQALVKRSPEIKNTSLEALYFCLLIYGQNQGVDSVTLEELQLKPFLWGCLFNLSSQQILEILEELHSDSFYSVSFVRTNQLYTLNFRPENPNHFLERAYERRLEI